MKKLLTLSLLTMIGVMFLFSSCRENAPIGDSFAEDIYVAKGAVISATNVVNGFFDLGDADNAFISADMVSEGEAVSGGSINVSLNGTTGVVTTLSSLPANVTITLNDVLSAVNMSISDVAIGDQAVFTFDAVTTSGTFRSSRSLTAPFSCFSGLGGTYSYVGSNLVADNNPGACPSGEVTGTVTFTDLGGGSYATSDLGFGQYESSCWNDGAATSVNATFTDVCNEISSGGLDQYGLVYIWVITDVSGPNLSISWTNDYADSGDAVITRDDGTDWPPLFTN